MDKVQVGDRWVGSNEPVFIIAEIGSNHDQRWDQGTQIIDAAASAGADAVKFQIYSADDLYSPGTPVYDIVKATELPPEWIPRLAEYSDKLDLQFFASVFSQKAVDYLVGVNVPAYKCASSEIANLPLLKYIASKQKPIIISTGMSDLADIYEAIITIESEGNTDVILLQCTSLYPTEPRHVHLRAMDTLRSAFQLPVGISDHTIDAVIPIAAIARGACVVEKHLTINRKLSGPDHSYALEPAEFKKMVEGIRATEDALGSPIKRMLPEEAELARRVSIRAAQDIGIGETLTRDLLVVERPAGGILPRLMDGVIGRKTRKLISKGEAVTWEKIN